MKIREFALNNCIVIVMDAPPETTHSTLVLTEGELISCLLKRKTKEIEVYTSEFKFDSSVIKVNNLINVGKLSIAEEGVIAQLFTPVKNGNFYDYEVHGIYYPTAISALKDIIEQECQFVNPFVLILKP